MKFDTKYLRWAIAHQLRFVAATVTILTLVTVAATHLIPSNHNAIARLLVEASSVSQKARASSDPLTDAAHLQNIENRLMTQTRLTALIDELDAEISVEKLRRATVFDPVSGRGKATTLTITVKADDPNLATETANLLADKVLAEHRIIRTERAEEALRFFRSEVIDSKTRLDANLAILLTFKTTHAGMLPEDTLGHIEQRKDIIARLATLPTAAPSSADRKRLEVDIRSARAIYSDQHPKVQLLLTKLEKLKAIVPARAGIDPNLPAELARIDAALAIIPANDLKLQALRRDHDLAEAQYEAAIGRLEAAAIEERIALRTNGDRLSIIERASLPDLPVGPKQRTVLVLGLALSVLAAAAMAILRARSDPYLRRPLDLNTGLGLTAYAVIPTMHTQAKGV